MDNIIETTVVPQSTLPPGTSNIACSLKGLYLGLEIVLEKPSQRRAVPRQVDGS